MSQSKDEEEDEEEDEVEVYVYVYECVDEDEVERYVAGLTRSVMAVGVSPGVNLVEDQGPDRW